MLYWASPENIIAVAIVDASKGFSQLMHCFIKHIHIYICEKRRNRRALRNACIERVHLYERSFVVGFCAY